MENIEKQKQSKQNSIANKTIYALGVFMLGWYGLWHLELMKEFANSTNGIALFDSISTVVPSVSKLKQATNFTYSLGLMHATVWIFVPFLIWWGYFQVKDGAKDKNKTRLVFEKLDVLGLKMQILMVAFWFVMFVDMFLDPLATHRHGTDERYFSSGMSDFLSFFSNFVFAYFAGGILFLIKLKIKQRINNG